MTLLSVGRGWKHSDGDGFGRRARPCVTFLVDHKDTGARAAWWAPESIDVAQSSGRHRFSTDVVSFGRRTAEHSPTINFGDAGLAVQGSPCLVVSDGTDDYLLTAGHVLWARDFPAPTAQPRDPSPPPEAVLDGGIVGEAIYACSYVLGATGRVDVGVVRLRARGLPPALRGAPWTTLRGIAGRGNSALNDLFETTPRTTCSIHAMRVGSSPVDLLAHFTDPTPSATERQTYAAETLVYRTQGQALRRGDSGGLIVSPDGFAIGLHFLGLDTAADADASTTQGLGLCLHSAVAHLEGFLRANGSPAATLSLVVN